MMDDLCAQFIVRNQNSTLYRPKMNGALKEVNKNIQKNCKKWQRPIGIGMRNSHLLYSHIELLSIPSLGLHHFHWSMVWGILPDEVEILLLQILVENELKEAEWARSCFDQLNFIEEKRLTALCHCQCYQKRIARAYNKKPNPEISEKVIWYLKRSYLLERLPVKSSGLLTSKSVFCNQVFSSSLHLFKMDGHSPMSL